MCQGQAGQKARPVPMRFKRLLEKNPFCRLDFPAAFLPVRAGPPWAHQGETKKRKEKAPVKDSPWG